jgi:cell division septum initiation protein DivIVA
VSLEDLKSRIEKMQAELNHLTNQGQDISSQKILQLSTQLDDLIVQYFKKTM